MTTVSLQSFTGFFQTATGCVPYEWQEEVANNGLPEVLPVPTGLGKTEGACLAWAWRLMAGLEPRHLVYCLPVRALVRQTVERLRGCFKRLGNGITVYQLMGDHREDKWAAKPDDVWVLGYGDEAEVIEPRALRESVARKLRAGAARYEREAAHRRRIDQR